MACRNLFYLSGTILNKCFLTKLQCCKQSFHTTTIYRRLGNSRKLRESFKKATVIESINPDVPPKRDAKLLWKHFCFTVGVSGAVVAGAIIWEYENMSNAYKRKHLYGFHRFKRSTFSDGSLTFWEKFEQGRILFIPILLANVVIFAAFQVPALRSTMFRYFTNRTDGRSSWALLFSVFSHYSLIHLSVNMYVLYSFCGYATAWLGKEQFLALYLTSGVVSSFCSQAYRLMIRRSSASLGASGAIAGVIGFMCFEDPHLTLTPIIFPFFSTEAKSAFYVWMAIETVGCFLQWGIFDHAAHLSGMLLGWGWHAWVKENVWYKRGVLTKMWHDIRSRSLRKE